MALQYVDSERRTERLGRTHLSAAVGGGLGCAKRGVCGRCTALKVHTSCRGVRSDWHAQSHGWVW